MPENIAIELPDGRQVQIAINRHHRSRRIRLSVDERGARVTLPTYGDLEQVQAFLHQHRFWLAQQLGGWDTAHASPLCIGESTHLPLLGEALPVCWQPARITRLQQHGGILCFEVSHLDVLHGQAANAAITRALHDFYTARARSAVAFWLPRYREALPRVPSRIQFKRMRSRWGSLSWQGSMVLELSLVLARPAAFEYVLVHELCHLIHHDHSPAFWQAVEKRFPAWREERDYLRHNGLQLKVKMQQLLG